MYVVKCSECGGYIGDKGESYYKIFEYIKGTMDRQCILTLCSGCKEEKVKNET